MTDLTKGPITRQILFFTIPYLIGNLFQQFYNIVDMVIVGRTLGSLAYTAVGSTGALMWFCNGILVTLPTGFSVITAQYFGASDKDGIKKSFGSSIWLTLIFAFAFSVLCLSFARPILEIIQTPPDLIEGAYRYLFWIFIGFVPSAFFNLFSNMIRALGDSKTPLVFLAIACVINIILDYTFIVFCGMDTNGVGLATVTAQLISAILCVVYIVKKQPALHINNLHLKWSGSMNKRLLNIGIPMAFLNMVLSVGGIIIQYAANGLGTIYVSAQVTGTKIINFVNLPVLSFGSALSVFCAQNYGAEKYDRVLTGGRKTNLMCIIWWLICLAVMIPFGKFFITLLAGEVEAAVMENAYLLLLFQTIFFIIVIPLILYKSLLQAVCRTFLTMMSGFTEIVGRAGLSIVCVYLIKAQIIDVSTGFIFICLAGPAAWLCGLITVAPDIFKVHRDFKLKIAERKNIQGNTDT